MRFLCVGFTRFSGRALLGNDACPLPIDHPDFGDLARLERNLLAAAGGQVAFEAKLRSFFRSAIDEVIDTARTGRYFLSELEKTEKTYLGTKFEILLRDWLDLPKGVVLDLSIDGEEVDVKVTTRSQWMIPPEAIENLCILLRVNETVARCDFGLVRARLAYLNAGRNRDQKGTLSRNGSSNIWWMVRRFAYTPNFWTLVSVEDRREIAALTGTRALAYLFEHYLRMAVSRIQIAAIARQDDPMRRVRLGGGARDILHPRGIAVLYSENDAALMRSLGLVVGKREFMSYRPRDRDEIALIREAGHQIAGNSG